MSIGEEGSDGGDVSRGEVNAQVSVESLKGVPRCEIARESPG